MKELTILLILFVSIAVHSQKIKGSLKDGGVQLGEPFSKTYRSISMGKHDPTTGWLTMSLPDNQRCTAYFNYDNKNQLKVVFGNGRSNVLFDIHDIEVEQSETVGEITRALASHKDMPGGKASIQIHDGGLLIIILESNTALEFTRPVQN